MELEQKVGQLTQQLEGMSAEREQVKGVADRFQGMEDRMKALLQLSEILSVRYNPFLEHEEPSLYDDRDANAFLPRGAPPEVARAVRRSPLAEVVPIEPDASDGGTSRPSPDEAPDAPDDGPGPRDDAAGDAPYAALDQASRAVSDDAAGAATASVALERATRAPSKPGDAPEQAARPRHGLGAMQQEDASALDDAWRTDADAAEAAEAAEAARGPDDPSVPAERARTRRGAPVSSEDAASDAGAAPPAPTLHAPARPTPSPAAMRSPHGVPAPPRLAFQALCWFERLARQGDPAEIHLFLEHYAGLGWIPPEHQPWMHAVAASVAPRRDGMTWSDVPMRPDELARLHRQHLRLLDQMFRTGFPDDRPDAWEHQAAQALEED